MFVSVALKYTVQNNMTLFEAASYICNCNTRVCTGPGNPGKPWRIFEALEKPWNFFMKPWKISQNFIEKINSSNGAFSGLNNKHLKSLAIRASDCQDLLAQIQRVLARPEIERSQFKFRWLCFYGYSSLLNMNKYVYGKCRLSIVVSCRCMCLLQYM